MKLLRYGPKGQEKPGLLDAAGRIRDLAGQVSDLAGPGVALEALAKLQDLDPDSLPLVPGTPRIGACLGWVPNFWCIGLNYSKHAAETGAKPPKEPILFNKATSALAGPMDDVVIPKDSAKSDWEVELGVVIGRRCDRVTEADALAAVSGYCTINDLSEREWQIERGGQWVKGKSAPGFGPCGPWLVTADEVADPQALDLWLSLNGERVQSSSTADMIFGVAETISYMSRFFTLLPGDLIATGTPSGVGMGMKPPRFLRPGDRLELEVQGLGRQAQNVVAFSG
jgi:2-keto-4-pentenoate hydratase/2-oxohepta-3-ene-1,7-dioic acid hydratase in catechol pathway